MGRGGSSLDVLALLLLLWSVRERFSEYSESTALMLSEYVIITSIFLYGVVQPGASGVMLTDMSELAWVSACFSE